MMWKSNPIRYVRRTHASTIQLNAYWHAADVGQRSMSVNHMNCLHNIRIRIPIHIHIHIHIDMGVIFSI